MSDFDQWQRIALVVAIVCFMQVFIQKALWGSFYPIVVLLGFFSAAFLVGSVIL